MSIQADLNAEWLEADGLGGFASGTVSGQRTRRYHGILLSAVNPPTGRFVLVNGFDALLETSGGAFQISAQHYTPDVTHPAGFQWLESFTADPWPTWVFRLGDGTRVMQELFAVHGSPRTVLRWKLPEPRDRAALVVRPFFSGRDYHSLHHENPAFRFQPEIAQGRLIWRPYDGVPGIVAHTNGKYSHEPQWYRNFFYAQEAERGLDCVEDLASPGSFRWDLVKGEAVWILEADVGGGVIESATDFGVDVDAETASLAEAEQARRGQFPTSLHRAADAYLVRRGAGKTIVAGYPWFTDWGRDTFIALRGLCLATLRLDDARDILLDWAGTVSLGMLPNRFPDSGETPEFNSVDASLWYVIAVHELLEAYRTAGRKLEPSHRQRLEAAVDEILSGYMRGTRFGIRLDDDGLLAAGEPGLQLTWMDAKVGDWVVTPRIGKPVEVQALWLNALWIAGRTSPEWLAHYGRGRAAFAERFWNAEAGCLYDVVDADHVPGKLDPTFRPNQIIAVGGLPLSILDESQAHRVVDAVEQRLGTPFGLRTLAPDAPGYAARYQGGVPQRDGAYHQGTVWPWLAGPFVEAWVRVRGSTSEAKREARERFLVPLRQHLQEAGLGHMSEIADGNPPHTPRGCPFQAWSLGELLRLEFVVLADDPAAGPKAGRRRRAVPQVEQPSTN